MDEQHNYVVLTGWIRQQLQAGQVLDRNEVMRLLRAYEAALDQIAELIKKKEHASLEHIFEQYSRLREVKK